MQKVEATLKAKGEKIMITISTEPLAGSASPMSPEDIEKEKKGGD